MSQVLVTNLSLIQVFPSLDKQGIALINNGSACRRTVTRQQTPGASVTTWQGDKGCLAAVLLAGCTNALSVMLHWIPLFSEKGLTPPPPSSPSLPRPKT